MAYSTASFGQSGAGTAARILAARTPIATAAPTLGQPGGLNGPSDPAGSKPPIARPAPPPAAKPPSTAGIPPGFAGLIPPIPTTPPAGASPAYLAYLRSLQYQQSAAQLAAQRQLQGLQSQMVIGPQALAAQGVIARRNISGAAESRGVFQSGERLQNLGDERTQEAQRLAALRLQGAQSYANIISTLQQTLAAQQNTAAENALAQAG